MITESKLRSENDLWFERSFEVEDEFRLDDSILYKVKRKDRGERMLFRLRREGSQLRPGPGHAINTYFEHLSREPGTWTHITSGQTTYEGEESYGRERVYAATRFLTEG